MANTTKLGLPKITDNMSADVVRDINALADGIDAKVGAPGGLATTDEVVAHTNENASLTAKGHVQLSSATDSDSETLAVTPKALKTGLATKQAVLNDSQKRNIYIQATAPTNPQANDIWIQV